MTTTTKITYVERQNQLLTPLGIWLWLPFMALGAGLASEVTAPLKKGTLFMLSVVIGALLISYRNLEIRLEYDSLLVKMRGMRWNIPRDAIRHISEVSTIPGVSGVSRWLGLGGSNLRGHRRGWVGFRRAAIVRVDANNNSFYICSRNREFPQILSSWYDDYQPRPGPVNSSGEMVVPTH